jgi:hypothetical protein
MHKNKISLGFLIFFFLLTNLISGFPRSPTYSCQTKHINIIPTGKLQLQCYNKDMFDRAPAMAKTASATASLVKQIFLEESKSI